MVVVVGREVGCDRKGHCEEHLYGDRLPQHVDCASGQMNVNVIKRGRTLRTLLGSAFWF